MTKPCLCFDLNEILTYRVDEITEFVGLVHPKAREIHVTPASQSGVIKFVASDRKDMSINTTPPLFRTVSNNIMAQYYETWNKLNAKECFLSKAYFHLFRMDSTYLSNVKSDGEYILLHCDPNEDDDHGDFKRSPHIHVECAIHPIKKVHFALNLMNLSQILTSRAELNKAFKSALMMLKKEVLEKDEIDSY